MPKNPNESFSGQPRTYTSNAWARCSAQWVRTMAPKPHSAYLCQVVLSFNDSRPHHDAGGTGQLRSVGIVAMTDLLAKLAYRSHRAAGLERPASRLVSWASPPRRGAEPL